MQRHRAFAASLGALAIIPACARQPPPSPDASPSVALPELPQPPVPSSAPSTAIASTPAIPDPGPFPQTHDMPATAGAAFEARRAVLWEAIVADDPERAMPFFFPLRAYQQVKDVADPAADWKHRLVGAYQRDIHALHARLGREPGEAKFLALEVPEARARWVEPGEEWNKIGYYRVFGTKLRYSADGAEHAFDVKSLISWRGEWFVVHLSAI